MWRGPAPGVCRHRGRVVWRESAALCIGTVDEEAIEALVGHHEETPVGVEGDVVRVRARLLDRVWSRIAG